MTKVFITGVSGFVGKTIAGQALKLGYDVSGVDRVGSNIPGIKVSRADIRDRKEMLRLTKGVDYIVHVAAITSNLEFEKDVSLCYDVNVNGFNSVIAAARENACERFVYASSSAIYEDNFSEDVVVDVNKMKNHYAKTKLINEMAAQTYSEIGDIETVGMRYFNIYGPGESRKGAYASIISIYINQVLNDGKIVIYGDGKQARDLIHVSDVAAISLELLKKGRSGVYNVGTGIATPYNDIADMVSSGEKVHIKNPLSTYQLLTKADTGKLLGAIGKYKFKRIEDGIREMVKAAGL